MIYVRDNGSGIPKEKLAAINDVLLNKSNSENIEKAGMSIGLVNVNERIRLHFGMEYGLHIYSVQEMGTSVEFILPCVECEDTEFCYAKVSVPDNASWEQQ